ncbi:hypothetical protein CWI75_08640 [Kineobactrum sediminis]|uniref:T6SS Phospholipase effector Tle1-like catalytic domain-containing protein n=1 Tax=Kineobactrum sediminis TaxID=1905677 RepID=A0A2N5Y2M7_9GAMM|nr:DUF2235 domain-containing protein [Kineobactrum sediminis]PLW82642.1 hypothetical protein CWI75_08640 [Kineobactrum sediminis]
MGKYQGKHIVICADGTWNDPESENPTNVLRVARALSPLTPAGHKQVVFYDWGVGSYYSRVRGGTGGLGMVKNIQDGYRFIVQNYNPGDRLFLFGFSRGAYTVRCLAGMLNNCGILKREQAQRIPEAFDLYKRRNAKPGSAAAERWRRANAVEGSRASVDFIGVWDTVGALGIPTRVLAFAEEKDLFFDPVLGSNVRVARHAVAMDEERADFEPTLWHESGSADLQQVWFAGVHADIGGGYAADKTGALLSDIPLAWMAREAEAAGLVFEPHLVDPGNLDHTAGAHRSYQRFWRALGRYQRRMPVTAQVHESVYLRHKAGVDSSPVLAHWLQLRDGKWGLLAG